MTSVEQTASRQPAKTAINRRSFTAGALALAAAPGGAGAQPANRISRIMLVHVSLPTAELSEGGFPPFSAFLEEMRRLGYTEGQNLLIERRSGQGRADPYGSLAREVVESGPDVIVTSATPFVAALKALTTTIPIVASINDPVASGLVTNLARPGGNITAFTADAGPELHGKLLQFFRELVPGIRRLGYLDARANWPLPGAVAVRNAGERLGLTVVPMLIDHPISAQSYPDAFANAGNGSIDAVFVGNSVENNANTQAIIDLANARLLPTANYDGRFARLGGLITYGPDLKANFRGMAGYVDRILKGAKPADLPVQLPREFELVINRHTARALSIAIPEGILVFATEVIDQ